MDPWLREHLVCPRDKTRLHGNTSQLHCAHGHTYPIADGIPILLVEEATTTHDAITKTLAAVREQDPAEPARPGAAEDTAATVDSFVQAEVPYTCGILYFPLQHGLKRYPIPEMRLPPGNGERLLDVGCNWGRWSISAARRGYRPVGIDPSLEAVRAARRVCAQLEVEATFLVADARFLPFVDGSFEVGFSYGVLQHFSKENARIALDELSRVTRRGAPVVVQMPNKIGLRSLQQRWRRGFSEGEGFEVRYWSPEELLATFEARFGATKLTADCYFGLGLQGADRDLLPWRYRCIVSLSEFLRRTSRLLPPLTRIADSVYLSTHNQPPSAPARSPWPAAPRGDTTCR
jgi:ubiquinone/menaquinone biosynthesis C-methylase UbiE/uncharacterized protein YbaR (Trm112 family)